MRTRRAFLKQAVATGAFAFAPGILRAQTADAKLDVAIVGGGVAGLFCAMRWARRAGSRVEVFESTDRTGGRPGTCRLVGSLRTCRRGRFTVGALIETSGRALLMASYHDGEMIDFWDALSDGPTFGAPDWIDRATGPDGEPIAPSMRKLLPASERLVKEVWSQVRKSHGLGDDLPEPVAATYQNWGRDPWGAAYHLWGIGAKPKDIIEYMQEPIPGIHICNEAWSVSQGWTNGAMQSADAMLVAKFGKKPFVGRLASEKFAKDGSPSTCGYYLCTAPGVVIASLAGVCAERSERLFSAQIRSDHSDQISGS